MHLFQTASLNDVCEEVFHLCGEQFPREKLKATLTPSSYCDKYLLFFSEQTGRESRSRVEYQRFAPWAISMARERQLLLITSSRADLHHRKMSFAQIKGWPDAFY